MWLVTPLDGTIHTKQHDTACKAQAPALASKHLSPAGMPHLFDTLLALWFKDSYTWYCWRGLPCTLG
jgi:hypothetical protein